MADLRALVIVASAVFSGGAHAGYAQLAPPVGWTSGGGLASGAGGSFNFGKAANTAQLVNGTVRTNAALNVGGRVVSVPATLRFAANAPRIAAAVIFAHPTLRTVATVASWLLAAGIVWSEAQKRWEVKQPLTGTVYCGAPGFHFESVCASSPQAAWSQMDVGDAAFTGCQDVSSQFSCTGKTQQGYSATRYLTFKEVSSTDPIPVETVEDFSQRINEKPVPPNLPQDIPDNLPIDLPEIQPLFIPTGNPVPNPNFDPSASPGPNNQPWNQPGVRVTPAPVPGSPWQVDLQPINRPVDNPNPDPNPKPDPNPGDGDKPTEKEPGLCEMYPDIVACQKLGSIDAKELPKKTVPLEISKQNVGPENGSCPAPRQFEIMGASMAFQWDLLCDFATGIRPILIGFAWLSAALAFVGLTRRGD